MSSARKAARKPAITAAESLVASAPAVAPPRFVDLAQQFGALYERAQREAPSPLERMADGIAVAEALVGRRVAAVTDHDSPQFRSDALSLHGAAAAAWRRLGDADGEDDEARGKAEGELGSALAQLGAHLLRGAKEAEALRELARDLPIYQRAVEQHAAHIARTEGTFSAEEVADVLRRIYAVVEQGSAKAPRVPKAVLGVIQGFAARRAKAGFRT